jgi:AraC-like DNA-binding protein
MAGIDVLSDILERSRARGAIYARSVFAAPWGFRFAADPCIQFHVVLGGTCLLRRDHADDVTLHQGDVVFIVAAEAYELADSASSPICAFEPFRDAVRRRRAFEWPGDGARTTLLCGGYDLDRDVIGPLRQLPPILHVRAEEAHRRPALRTTVSLLGDEVQRGEPGAQVIADRLVDALLVQVVRSWLAERRSSFAGWSSGPADAAVARALELIHAEPAADWTLDGLARAAGVSRSTLARRFSCAIGETPIAYLTRWRMTLAMESLRDTSLALTVIAERAGYDSVFAFSSAFKRVTGEPPSRYRARSPGSRSEARALP